MYNRTIGCVRTYEIAFWRNKDWGDINFPIAMKEYCSKQVSKYFKIVTSYQFTLQGVTAHLSSFEANRVAHRGNSQLQVFINNVQSKGFPDLLNWTPVQLKKQWNQDI